jgi:lipoprotein-anchoring transpeptidase ErfK/SrfK
MLRLDHRAAAPMLLALLVAVGMLLTAGAGGAPGPRKATVARTPPARPAARPASPAGQPLVVLLRDHVVRAAPRAHARSIGWVASRRPITRVRTVLPVLGRGAGWVHVRLPGRPNGHAGWISANRTRPATTDWRITIRLSSRRVTVYHRGRAQGRFRAVIGGPATPTPRGRFFVEEIVHLSRLGRPFALAISARSGVYRQFAGGPGQIALHGTTGIPGALGAAVSHGCVRLSARAMRWLARHVGPGVPLTIRA